VPPAIVGFDAKTPPLVAEIGLRKQGNFVFVIVVILNHGSLPKRDVGWGFLFLGFRTQELRRFDLHQNRKVPQRRQLLGRQGKLRHARPVRPTLIGHDQVMLADVIASVFKESNGAGVSYLFHFWFERLHVKGVGLFDCADKRMGGTRFLHDGFLGDAGHPHGGSNGATFDKAIHYLDSLVARKSVHGEHSTKAALACQALNPVDFCETIDRLRAQGLSGSCYSMGDAVIASTACVAGFPYCFNSITQSQRCV